MALDLTDTKSALQSKGVWGGIIAVLAGLVGIWGYKVSAVDQAQIVDLVVSSMSVVGGAIAIVGRIMASKAIK